MTEDLRALLRADLGRRVPVHVIGGIGGQSSGAQYRAVVTASRRSGALGVSVYDWHATGAPVWPIVGAAWRGRV